MTRPLLLTAVAVVALGLVAPAAAEAAPTGSPPVTAPDGPVVLYPGQLRTVDVLANDTDPDGDELAVCRLGKERQRELVLSLFSDSLDVMVDTGARPGTYAFTYYACDLAFLTPGTVTVEVRALPRVDVTQVRGRPGVVRVRSRADFPVRFLYGSFDQQGPDGVLRVPARSSRTVRLTRRVVDWMVFDRRGELFVASGTIRLPARHSADHSAKASSGGHAQTRLRSPYAWSMRATGGQYLSGSIPVGKTPTSRS
jgi:hypothetical protein